MTISTESSVVTYIGNGSTTSFPFSFVGVSADDISVIYTDTSGTQTTLDPTTYTLVLTPAAPGELWGIGGTMTYPNVGSPIALNTQLSIIREVPYTQDVSISNQGAFYPKAVEQGLDLLELQLQQTNTDVTYAIKTPITDPTPPGILPSAAERANLYLGFDSLGQPTVLEGVPGSGGNVSSVALSAPEEFVVTGSPIINSGTLTLTKALESSNTVYAGPGSGSSAQPTFRTLVPTDLPVATVSLLGAVRPDGTSVTVSGGVLSVAAGQGANPTATAGPLAVNGTSSKFMRADAAPAVQLGSASQKGLVQVDGTTITASSGVISAVPSAGAVTTTGSPATGELTKFSGSQTVTNGDLSGDITTSGSLITTLSVSGVTAGTYGDSTHVSQVVVDAKGRVTSASDVAIAAGAVGANPTATASDTAVNGTALTFMRSDAAPAVQKASSSLFGLVKPDNSTITISGGVISSAPSGYNPGTPPTMVQFASAVSGGNSVVFGTAPTNGNLLVAMCFNPTSDSPGSGWTVKADITTGSDFGVVLTKTAGAGESTTQSPLSGVSTIGVMAVWELHAASTPTFLLGQTQVEQTGQSNLPVLIPNATNCIGLSAVSAVTNNIASAVNFGVQDALNNTNTDRKLAAGHCNLANTPMAGIIATFASSTSTKSATAIVSA